MPIEFFRVRVFTVSMISLILIRGAMFGAILFILLYMQVVIGRSATDSGLVLTPMMLGMVFAAAGRGEAVAYMVLVGAGLGVTFPLYTVAVQNAFNRHQIGVVTSAGQLFRRIGGTIGTAAFGIMITTRFASEMNAGLAQIDPGLLDSVPPGLIAQILDNPQRLATVRARPSANRGAGSGLHVPFDYSAVRGRTGADDCGDAGELLAAGG